MFEAKITVKKRGTASYARILGSNIRHKRSSVSMKEAKDQIEITIVAADAVALRASLNTVTRGLQVADSILKADFHKSAQSRKR